MKSMSICICVFFSLSDGRKDKNDVSNDNAVDNEQKNQEISSSNSHHSSTPKIDQSTNRTSYRNMSYRNENCTSHFEILKKFVLSKNFLPTTEAISKSNIWVLRDEWQYYL